MVDVTEKCYQYKTQNNSHGWLFFSFKKTKTEIKLTK